MIHAQFEDADFFKSSLSNYKWVKACVQVAAKDNVVAVRDSKDIYKTTLHFTVEEWEAFVAGVKAGEFDLPFSKRFD